jgi:hypothetical protein
MRRFYVIFTLLTLDMAPAAWAQDFTVPKASLKSGTSTNKNARTFFLVTIGIDKYQDEFWPALKWPVRDAELVARDFGQGTGTELKVFSLVNSKASYDEIMRTLDGIAKVAEPQDTVAVYVSSHGTLAMGKRTELEPVVVLSNTRSSDVRKTGLPQRTLREWVAGIRAKRKLLIFATCHSGLGKSKLPPEVKELLSSSKGKVRSLDLVSEGVMVFAAAASGETARENNVLRGDVYTHFFLEALKVYDRDHDGRVTSLEAHDYAKEKTFHFSDGRQRATAEIAIIGDGDITLRGKRSNNPIPVLEAYDQKYSGLEIAINGKEKGRLPLAFPLDPGKNTISIFAEDETKPLGRYEVSAQAGEVLNLSEVFAQSPWLVGVQAYYLRWRDPRFKKLTGSMTTFHGELAGFYQWRGLRLGLAYSPPLKRGEKLWSGLEAKIEESFIELNAGYVHSWSFGLSLQSKVAAGYDSFKFILEDNETGRTVSKVEKNLFYGFGIGAELVVLSRLALSLGVEHHVVKHDFGYLGALDASRTLATFGAGFKFGGRAKKL